MTRQLLVTAALPYSNGKPHVGHVAGAYLPADIYVRYLRATGARVLFICGSDDNGGAIELAAWKAKTTPEAIVATFNAAQKEAFDRLGMSFDVYGGTHMPHFVERHNRFSQAFFRSIHEKGYFTKRATNQFFDPTANKFLPDRYVEGTCAKCGYERANGDQCEQCGDPIEPRKLLKPRSVLTGVTPELRETVHWHLRLDAFEEPLRQWLAERQNWRPIVVNQALAQIKDGLSERAMTRDLTWGVPLPLDDPDGAGKVLYVWFDAPVGYVSFTAQHLVDAGGFEDDYQQWWKNTDCKIVHFIGEDNINFHAIIWPAMLMAEGSFQLPHQVVANSFLNIRFPGKDEDEKISKSRGTAIFIDDYLSQYDPDPLRYYLTAIAPEAARTAYEPEDFLDRNDNELVAALGNFVHRVVSFAHKYFEGRVPPEGVLDAIDQARLADRAACADRVAEHIDGFRFKAALGEVMAFARAGNLYLDQKKPWSQRKTDMAACGTTINVCLRTIKALMVVMQPFLPFAARKCLEMLRLGPEALAWDQTSVDLPAGHALGEAAVLFRKLRDEHAGAARAAT